ncbi:MAG: iron-sulfur cluster assembly scaffold protein [Campylobacterota bacterium]|nr:iron-sulfur cluster assembly scaffold protein [Campylobacterota bacterium]
MNVDSQLIEHMMEPKNYGSMSLADGEGIGKNPENGEKVLIYLRVSEENGKPKIEDIRFQAIGCTTTVVAGSMITEEAKGLSFERAEELIDVTMKLLERVPPEDAACSEMVAIALKAAMETYRERKGDPEYPTVTYQIENSCAPKEENLNENTGN